MARFVSYMYIKINPSFSRTSDFLFPTNLFFRKIVATFDVLNFMGKVTSFLFRFAYGMC